MEMLIGIVLLGLITGAVLYLYLMGGRAVSQGDMRGDLSRELQLAGMSLTREIETSCYEGLSLGPNALAVLSSVPPAGGGPPTLGPDGSVVWQKYVVLWLDGPSKILYRREVPIPATVNGSPIEAFEGKTLADYLVDGSPVGRNLVDFSPAVLPTTRTVRTRLEAERPFRGEMRRLALTVNVRLKN